MPPRPPALWAVLLVALSLILLPGCPHVPESGLGGVTSSTHSRTSGTLSVRIRTEPEGQLGTQATVNQIARLDLQLVLNEVASQSRTLQAADLLNGGASASVTFQELLPGLFKVRITAHDSTARVIGYTEANGSITAGETTLLSMHLRLNPTYVYTQPATGSLGLDLSLRDGAQKSVEMSPSVIKVLILRYFPLDPDGQRIDAAYAEPQFNPMRFQRDLTYVKQRCDVMTRELTRALTMSSAFQGYKNAQAVPALSYEVLETKDFYTPMASKSTNTTYHPFKTDYMAVFSSFDLKDYVERQGVDEVWIWSYGPLEGDESVMGGPSGNISNSYLDAELPMTNRTYTVYNYNYWRGTDNALHEYCHQTERELEYVNRSVFRSFHGPLHPLTTQEIGRCGNVHNPPNSVAEYNYSNVTLNSSDCEDWDYNRVGSLTQVNVQTWSRSDFALVEQNAQMGYLIWWRQHMPAFGNQYDYPGMPTNWWDIHTNFDAMVPTDSSPGLGGPIVHSAFRFEAASTTLDRAVCHGRDLPLNPALVRR